MDRPGQEANKTNNAAAVAASCGCPSRRGPREAVRRAGPDGSAAGGRRAVSTSVSPCLIGEWGAKGLVPLAAAPPTPVPSSCNHHHRAPVGLLQRQGVVLGPLPMDELEAARPWLHDGALKAIVHVGGAGDGLDTEALFAGLSALPRERLGVWLTLEGDLPQPADAEVAAVAQMVVSLAKGASTVVVMLKGAEGAAEKDVVAFGKALHQATKPRGGEPPGVEGKRMDSPSLCLPSGTVAQQCHPSHRASFLSYVGAGAPPRELVLAGPPSLAWNGATIAALHQSDVHVLAAADPAATPTLEAPLPLAGNPTLDAVGAFVACLRTDRPDGLYTTVVVDECSVALGLVYSSADSIRVRPRWVSLSALSSFHPLSFLLSIFSSFLGAWKGGGRLTN